jgi:hypothetical protein
MDLHCFTGSGFGSNEMAFICKPGPQLSINALAPTWISLEPDSGTYSKKRGKLKCKPDVSGSALIRFPDPEPHYAGF